MIVAGKREHDVKSINELFIERKDQSSLNRFFTESRWNVEDVVREGNELVIGEEEEEKLGRSIEYKILDDTVCRKYSPKTEMVCYNHSSTMGTVLSHDYVTSLYVNNGTAIQDGLKLYGNAIVTLIPEGNEVEVPSVGDRPSRLIPQRLVGEILEPRARELFEMLRDNLRHAGMLDLCAGGVVLSGGASRLPGALDIAESVLRRPVRLSWPAPLAKMPSTLAEPEYATVLGMAFYGHRARIARGQQEEGWSARLKGMFVGRGA